MKNGSEQHWAGCQCPCESARGSCFLLFALKRCVTVKAEVKKSRMLGVALGAKRRARSSTKHSRLRMSIRRTTGGVPALRVTERDLGWVLLSSVYETEKVIPASRRCRGNETQWRVENTRTRQALGKGRVPSCEPSLQERCCRGPAATC